MSHDPSDWLACVDGGAWEDAEAWPGGLSSIEAAEAAAKDAYEADPGSHDGHHIDVDVRRRGGETVYRYRVHVDFTPDFSAHPRVTA